MLSHPEFLEVLNSYNQRLEQLSASFRRGQSGGYYLSSEDEALSMQTIQELIDLFNDNIRNNPYSVRVAGIANEWINGYPERVSPKCIQELSSLVLAIKTRVDRAPEIVKGHQPAQAPVDPHWPLLHPTVVALGKPRMEAGHYADAVEACLKELNTSVKLRHQQVTGQELDGVDLMRKAFKLDAPSIVLAPLVDETGKNIQRGYLDLFAGSMAGVRNPKAHGNIQITRERAIHFLFLASLLFFKLEEAA
jgi:uncharacterized protein (TIGR02391 family)